MPRLTPYQRQKLGSYIPNVISYLVARRATYQKIVSQVRSHNSRISLGTIKSFYDYYKEQGQAADRLVRADINKPLISLKIPGYQRSSEIIRINFQVETTMRGGLDRTFTNLFVEVPADSTVGDVMRAMRDVFNSMFRSLYDVSVIAFIPRTMRAV